MLTDALFVAEPLTIRSAITLAFPWIWMLPVLFSPPAVTVSPVLILPLPMNSALLFVLLMVSVPPTVRLLPPPPLLNGELSQTMPPLPPLVPRDGQSAGGGDRRSG